MAQPEEQTQDRRRKLRARQLLAALLVLAVLGLMVGAYALYWQRVGRLVNTMECVLYTSDASVVVS